MGLLTNNDAEQFRSWFKEMAELLGIRCGYQYPLGNEKTIHSEPNMAMSNPIELDIIFSSLSCIWYNILKIIIWLLFNKKRFVLHTLFYNNIYNYTY